MYKTDKIVRLRGQRERSVQVVREHYVREDVPCYSGLCIASCAQHQDTKCSVLPSDVTHYVVPDCTVARDYNELLDFTELTGILVMQTVLNAVQQRGRRRAYRRLSNYIKDPRKLSAVFYNEFQQNCYCPREPGEPLADWERRSVYEGSTWYYNHLAGQISIIILTVNTQFVERYCGSTLGVYVVHLQDYLKKFWPDQTNLQLQYESLAAAVTEKEANTTGRDYQGYLPSEVLHAGVSSGLYIQGALQVNKYNAQKEATIRTTGLSTKSSDGPVDVYICGMTHRNRAVHGDIVVVELLPRSEWRGRSSVLRDSDDTEELPDTDVDTQPTGRVVGVVQRNWRDYIVTMEKEEMEEAGNRKRKGKILTVPMDWRIPKIRISTRQHSKLRDKRFVVRIDTWDVGSQYPSGHFVRELGPSGDLETELLAVLMENQLATAPFSEAQLAELPTNSPAAPWSMDPAEVSRRRDLRDTHLVFSIDPKGCEDVDDTLSVRRLWGGGLELGVHIADVTHFVPHNSLTDQEARARSTTVYLADRRFDMLPAVLSADLCSLVSGVDRYAMSVIWELDEDYEVQDVWYGRTVIRSQYKLFYELAQRVSEAGDADLLPLADQIPEMDELDDEEKLDSLLTLRWSVSTLMQIARALKCRRSAGGALDLESTEVAVQMAESKEITDLVPKQSLEIHDTIAECMIFANHWVAKKICQAFPSHALLRHHPLPRQDQFAELTRCAEACGFHIDTASNKSLADSLDRCVDPDDPEVNKVLRSLATMAMSNASYFSTGSLPRHEHFHYGLALDFYTHYTSPIRRYADIIVHRLLLAALGETPTADLFTNSQLHEASEHMNNKHRSAQYAQRASVELFQSLFFKGRAEDDEACIVDAVVLQIRPNGLMVQVPRYGLKGAVYLVDPSGDVAYVGDSGRAEWTPGKVLHSPEAISVLAWDGPEPQTYRLLDHVTACVVVKDSYAHSSAIKLKLVRNVSHHSNHVVDAKQQKDHIINAVVKASTDSKQTSDNVHLGPDFQEWQAEYGQTDRQRSFYDLLQTIDAESRLDV